MANYQSTHTGQEHDAYCTKSQLINLIYPVGAIYISVNSTSPQTLFGGTWQQIADTFLLAAGATYTAGSTGGEATHTLNEAEIPQHWHDLKLHVNGVNNPATHTFGYSNWNVGSGTNIGFQWGNYIIRAEGGSPGGTAHNNMPPYLSVYMWKRTA